MYTQDQSSLKLSHHDLFFVVSTIQPNTGVHAFSKGNPLCWLRAICGNWFAVVSLALHYEGIFDAPSYLYLVFFQPSARLPTILYFTKLPRNLQNKIHLQMLGSFNSTSKPIQTLGSKKKPPNKNPTNAGEFTTLAFVGTSRKEKKLDNVMAFGIASKPKSLGRMAFLTWKNVRSMVGFWLVFGSASNMKPGPALQGFSVNSPNVCVYMWGDMP